MGETQGGVPRPESGVTFKILNSIWPICVVGETAVGMVPQAGIQPPPTPMDSLDVGGIYLCIQARYYPCGNSTNRLHPLGPISGTYSALPCKTKTPKTTDPRPMQPTQRPRHLKDPRQTKLLRHKTQDLSAKAPKTQDSRHQSPKTQDPRFKTKDPRPKTRRPKSWAYPRTQCQREATQSGGL